MACWQSKRQQKRGSIHNYLIGTTVLFDCDVDIRIGSGFLNYINGYVSKSSDCVDFSAKEYSEADGDGAENTEWKRT